MPETIYTNKVCFSKFGGYWEKVDQIEESGGWNYRWVIGKPKKKLIVLKSKSEREEENAK